MVTHRISAASLADRMIFFKDGKIVEKGNHKELFSRKGEYYKPYITQSKWYDR